VLVIKDTEVPVEGGNLEKLKIIVGEDKTSNAVEFTITQWEG
jgi:hypothetical protein